jgi:hypothetical protein
VKFRDRTCCICNERYPPTGGRQKYCPDCTAEAQRRKDRAKYYRKPEQYLGYARARRREKPKEVRAKRRELYARHSADPEFVKKRAAQQHEAYLRRRADPAFVEKQGARDREGFRRRQKVKEGPHEWLKKWLES